MHIDFENFVKVTITCRIVREQVSRDFVVGQVIVVAAQWRKIVENRQQSTSRGSQ